MKPSTNLLTFLFLICSPLLFSQNSKASLGLEISVDNLVKSTFKNEGRLLIYLSHNENREPRYSSGTGSDSYVFGKNIPAWKKGESLVLSSDSWMSSTDWDLNSIPMGDYFLQAVWNQSGDTESRSNVPGNLYSKKVKIELKKSQTVKIELSEIIPDRKIPDHELADVFSYKSEILSNWWQKPMIVSASVLLPSGYAENPDKSYPVRYNVAGYGGRYTRIDRLVNNKEFMDWWSTKEAPQVITVFLDGEGPFGDSYQLDSKNNGPFGESLIKELIPQIEKEFRILGTTETRFVDGCSTGGWVSLALQLFYPNTFNGCWSYSPDPVSFKKMQLVNIYSDENAFYNKNGYLRPSRRDIYGEPTFSIKKEIYSENVQGTSNTYVTSGQQWGSWNALYSPKGKDGLPMAIFDPITGKIDKDVAGHWTNYDLLQYSRDNWEKLGPAIQGKIYIWMGDMDNYYLNNSMRDFDAFYKSTKNPKSDANIEFSPMKGHCSNYSHKFVLEEIKKRVDALN